MNSTSPANSSASTTAVVGGGGGNAALDLVPFATDLAFINMKEDTMHVLKTDILAALNKEVKSLDEDNWMFEGPRSRIHLISRPGGFLNKKMQVSSNKK